MIFIDHVPGTVFENFTSRNFGFSDAAELFVFLAGFASAYAYAPLFMAGHRFVACLKAWRRAGVLYLVHITLTVLAIGIFSWGALAFGQGNLLKEIGLTQFITVPIETMIGVATLAHQLGYVNILPMYSAILLMLPLHLYLASIGRYVMLSAAILGWVAVYVWHIDMPAYPLPGGWFFNPFSWQVVFAFGLFAGLSRKASGVAVPYRHWAYGLALGYALICFVSVRWSLWWLWGQLPFPVLVSGFDKTYVSAPRLLHILALCYLFAHASKGSPFASMAKENPFVMLGRHSLPVFAVGTALSLCGQVVKHGGPTPFWLDCLLIAGGLSIQFALARYLDWWHVASKVKFIPAGDPMAVSAAGSLATPASHLSPQTVSGTPG